MKQALVSPNDVETSPTVQEAETEPEALETDVPEDVQNEIRALAAAEADALVVEEPPEETLHEEEPPEDVEGEGEAFEADVQAEEAEEPLQEPPTPPRPPRRFEFAFRAEPLKAFLGQVAQLVDEAKLVANREGWHVRAVDAAHVALIDVHLTDVADALERVDGTPQSLREDVAFGVDVEKLFALVKKAKKDDIVRIAADLPNASGKDELTVEMGGMTRTMAPIDIADLADPRIPGLTLPATIEMGAADLLLAAKAAEDVSDHLRLTVTRDGLTVSAEGDVDKVSIDFRRGENVEVEFQGSEEAYSSLFALDYLISFLKTVKHETLVLRLGTDFPVRVDWVGTTRGTYLCAPRIETPE
jgi:proliferating cell nuclear antigen